MNKKHTLIHSGTAVDNPHQYHVTIGTDMGQFSGTVVCRSEDYKNESRYFGFELAEIKAEIQYARAKRNYYEAQLKALLSFGAICLLRVLLTQMLFGLRRYAKGQMMLKRQKASGKIELNILKNVII